MFEDLSRLIDHQIYLATQTCLRSLQGHGNHVGSSSCRPSESAAAAAATSGSTWNRRPVLSSSSSTPTPWTASRTASQHHDIQTQPGRRDGGGREEGGNLGAGRLPPRGRAAAGGGTTSRFAPLGPSFLSPALSRIVEIQEGEDEGGHGLVEGFEELRLGGSSSTITTTTKMTTTTKTPPLKPLPQPWGARSTGTGTTTTIAADTHGQQGSPRSPRVVQIPRRRPSPRPGVVVEGTLPLAQRPAGGGAWRGNTNSTVPDDGDNRSSRSSSDGDVFPKTDRGQAARLFQQTSSQAPRSPTSNTRSMTTAAAQVPRVRSPPQESSFQPTARQQQGQQRWRRSAEEEDEDEDEEEEEDPSDDSSQLSNLSNITLLVPDVSQLKHFYERVFGVAPVHEDRASVTFPFHRGRLGVTLMEYHPHDDDEPSRSSSSRPPPPPQHSNTHGAAASSMRDAPLGRHRDVGMSVLVEDIEQVWDRLRMLEEGKGKAKEGGHQDGDDGLRFGGLAATADGTNQHKPSRVWFRDPAGYSWEVKEFQRPKW